MSQFRKHSNSKPYKKIIPFEENLSHLHPVGRVDLRGLSLVTKYSHDLPEFILTCDESGYVYLINSLELELKKEKELSTPIHLLPKSKKKMKYISYKNKNLEEYKCDNGAIFDVEWYDNSQKFLIASGQSNSLVWDTETGEICFQNPLNNCSIRTIKSCLYNNSFIIFTKHLYN